MSRRNVRVRMFHFDITSCTWIIVYGRAPSPQVLSRSVQVGLKKIATLTYPFSLSSRKCWAALHRPNSTLLTTSPSFDPRLSTSHPCTEQHLKRMHRNVAKHFVPGAGLFSCKRITFTTCYDGAFSDPCKKHQFSLFSYPISSASPLWGYLFLVLF